MEEVQVKTERPLFPEERSEHQTRTGKDNSIYQRVAELLWYREHEKPDRGRKWVVVPSDSYVHLETMEKGTDEIPQPEEVGNTREVCLDGCE